MPRHFHRTAIHLAASASLGTGLHGPSLAVGLLPEFGGFNWSSIYIPLLGIGPAALIPFDGSPPAFMLQMTYAFPALVGVLTGQGS